MYFLPIPTYFYRVIALRYALLLALGCWVCGKINEGRGRTAYPLFQAICFIAGCAYIAFFSLNRENTDIFRYTTWGNTNVFSCLYIVPLFYATLAMFRDYRIRTGWLHSLVSAVGQRSYYILCTQMVMFWYVGRIWTWLGAPLAVSVACNILMAVASGIIVNWLVNRVRRVQSKLTGR